MFIKPQSMHFSEHLTKSGLSGENKNIPCKNTFEKSPKSLHCSDRHNQMGNGGIKTKLTSEETQITQNFDKNINKIK